MTKKNLTPAVGHKQYEAKINRPRIITLAQGDGINIDGTTSYIRLGATAKKDEKSIFLDVRSKYAITVFLIVILAITSVAWAYFLHR